MPIFNDDPGGTLALPPSFIISATYIALLVLLQVALMILVIRRRRSAGVAFGDDGDGALTRGIRIHGNFTENVPPALAMLVMLPLVGAAPLLIHVLGSLTLLGRLCHAFGLSRARTTNMGRVLGVAFTIASQCFGAAALLVLVWRI